MNIKKILHWMERYERHLSAAAMIGGFIFDYLTLTQIDTVLDNAIIILYISIAAIGILVVNAYETQKISAKPFAYIHAIFPLVVQFVYGGLFSMFTVLYSRSSTLIGSWPFILFLAAMLIGNEFLQKHYRRVTLQIGILYFVLFSYLIFAVPLVTKTMGNWTFIGSGLISLIGIWLYLILFRKLSIQLWEKSKKFVKLAIIVIWTVINLLYFTNVIPPVPLSLKHVGVYHSVTILPNGDYEVQREKMPWYDWLIGREIFHYSAGDTVYVVSSIYAPLDLETEVKHVWQMQDTTGNWQTMTEIPFSISGGRLNGYRGFSLKQQVTAGKWRVLVETLDGKIIGSEVFYIKDAQKTPSLKDEIVQ